METCTTNFSPSRAPRGRTTRPSRFAPVLAALLCAAPNTPAYSAVPSSVGSALQGQPLVQFEMQSQSALEGAGTLAAKVTLSVAQASDVSVSFSLAGSASTGVDYAAPVSPLVIPASSLEANLVFVLTQDTLPEPTESIQITLTGASGASLGANVVHVAAILDDDGPYTNPGRKDPVPFLIMAPTNLVFPATKAGTASATQAVTVTNPSNRQIQLDGFTFSGIDASEFSALASVPLPLVLGPLSTAVVEVRMSPNAQGSLSASMRLKQTPHPHQQVELNLTGTCFGPTAQETLVDCGGYGYQPPSGPAFAGDYGHAGFTSLAIAPSGADITGTLDDLLYSTARQGSAFSYAFGLPNGPYRVTLHFAEVNPTATIGGRVFQVKAEGTTLVTGLDLASVAGPLAAHDLTFEVLVSGGSLELQFIASAGKALINAIEVKSYGVLQATPEVFNFSSSNVGQVYTQQLDFLNDGLHALNITSVEFTHTQGNSEDFRIEFGTIILPGSLFNATKPFQLALAPGGAQSINLVYEPTEHIFSEFALEFEGDFSPSKIINVTAVAGVGGDPYLHPVILVDELVVDYDANGVEDVLLDGSDSHTHEPLHTLTEWIWEEGAATLATQEIALVTLPVGPHDVQLTIKDDNTPKHQLATHQPFQVVDVDQVPGVLCAYYDATGTGMSATELLDLVPLQADFAEIRGALSIEQGLQGTIGGSPFTASTMALARASIDVKTEAMYAFVASGGAAQRLFVNGSLYSAPLALGVGKHALEVRWAFDSLAQLPGQLTAAIDGGSQAPLDPKALTHDPRTLPPAIHAMPSSGSVLGGYSVVIDGFGFFPKNQTTVHWGNTLLTAANFTQWSADQIEFTAPPGGGTIAVTVQTPHGTSKARQFLYDPQSPPPIVFALGPVHGVGQPTCATWGPDGRLYVGQRTGHIKAFEFNPDYSVASMATYPGVSALTNKEILGLGFSPYPSGPLAKLYVAHSHLYAQGGLPFSGPAPYTGQISVLTAPSFDVPVALVTGLPTSNHDHGVNSIEFDHNGDLLVPVGSNTNAGVKHPQMGDLPESPLSAAILKVEITNPAFAGAVHYVVTATGVPTTDQVLGEQSEVVPDSHVYLHAVGLRNSYDLTLTTWGDLYATDNGANWGFGAASTGPDTQTSGDPNAPDRLQRVEYSHYYGHANRARGHKDPIQNVWKAASEPSDWNYTAPMQILPSSSNGIVEYRSTTFGNQLRGNLLIQKWNDQFMRLVLSPDKKSVVSLTDMTPITDSLDLLTGPGGALIGIDYSSNALRVFLPQDAGAIGLVATEITPWRAPMSGGTTFVIGGNNFGTLQNTSVTIGGVPATLTSVSPTRIQGTIPAALTLPSSLQNVVVTVASNFVAIPAAFLYLPATPGLHKGSWAQLSNMPEQIGEVACGVIQGRLYVVGESSNKTLARNPLTGNWVSNLAVRPFVGHHHAAEVHGEKWYLIGGLDAGQGKLQIYDPATDTWSLGADMPWAGGSVATCLINGKIYASGGIVGNATVDNCAVYDIATDTWTNLAPMPFEKGRNHAASGTDGAKFWIFGGRGVGSGPGNFVANGFADAQIYDPATNTWSASFDLGSTIPPMPIGRGGTGKAVFFKNEFYVFGGETFDGAGAVAGNVYDRVDVYNPAAQVWRAETIMPTPRHGIFPVIVQGKIYVAGGGTVAGFSKSAAVEVFSK